MGGPASNGISRAPLYLGSVSEVLRLSSTRLSLSLACFSNTVRLDLDFFTLRIFGRRSLTVPLPRFQQRLPACTGAVWAVPFSLTTTGGSSSISFPPGTEMFHFSGFLSILESRNCFRGVAPFRYPRVDACLRLSAAFRSLLRLSSAVSAKASVICPLYLNLIRFRPIWLSRRLCLYGSCLSDKVNNST